MKRIRRHFITPPTRVRFKRAWLAVACFWMLSSPSAPAASVPAAAGKTAGTTLPGYEVIPLGQGHNNRLCLAATIGGKKGLMLLDTGANATLLNEATYRSLLSNGGGSSPKGLPKTTSVNGMKVPVAMAPDFRVAHSNLGTLPVALVPNRFLYEVAIAGGSDSERRYDGLLGENILKHYNAVVDCDRLVLYLNVDPTKKVSFAQSLRDGGWTRIPMTSIGNDFTVPCVVNEHHFRVIVDTGAPFTHFNRHMTDAAHLESRDMPMLHGGLIGDRAQETGLVTAVGMQIGDYTIPSTHILTTPVSYSDFGGPHDESQEGAIAGLLGCDALAANHAIIDVGNKTLYLKRVASGNKP